MATPWFQARGATLVLSFALQLAASASSASGILAAHGLVTRSWQLNGPLHFEPVAARSGSITHIARADGHWISVDSTGAKLLLAPTPDATDDTAPRFRGLGLTFANGRRQAEVQAEQPRRAVANHFLGAHAEHWRPGVPTSERVRLRGIYPGIDAVFYGRGRTLEFDLEIAPGANAGVIALRFEGHTGLVLEAGDLLIRVGADVVRQRAPVAYQQLQGTRQAVAAAYQIDDSGLVRFELGPYDAEHTLVIDPVIERSTLFGSSQLDEIQDVETDAQGNLIVVGRTLMLNPTDFPLVAAFQTVDDTRLVPGRNAFVSKFGPTGELLFSTYLGGELIDEATSVAVDGAGHIYVTGFTQSHIDHGGFALAEFNGFPTTPGAYLTNGLLRFEQCVFLTKLNAGGGLVYSTLVTRNGMSGNVTGRSVAVDAIGNAFVTGDGAAIPMVMTGGGTTLFNGAFLMKFNSSGTTALYTNLIANGQGRDVAVAPDGTAHWVGRFSGELVTTPDAYAASGGTGGTFYRKLDPGGNLAYSTAFALFQESSGRAVAVDLEGRALIAGGIGERFDPFFPGHFLPINPLQANFGGGSDVFLARFDTRLSGSNVVDFATYLGGAEIDQPTDVALDPQGRILLTGITSSTNFILSQATQTNLNGAQDAFVMQINAAATGVEFASYLGGKGFDTATGIAPFADGSGFAVAGFTDSRDFPTTNAFQPSFKGGESDGFLATFREIRVTETLIVNSNNDLDDGVCDSAHCSLREAIAASNRQPGPQTITFQIPGTTPAFSVSASHATLQSANLHNAPVPPVIRLTRALPPITDAATLDAHSQPGAQRVVLDGTAAGTIEAGLLLQTSGALLRGVVLQRFSKHGLVIRGGGGNRVEACWIGTTADGLGAATNGGAGILIEGSGTNWIGGDAPDARNVIAGNRSDGIQIQGAASTGTHVRNNFIGLGADGRTLIPNAGAGISIHDAPKSQIGGERRVGNVIGGNEGTGIRVSGLLATATVIQGNLIGLAANGTSRAANQGSGITLSECVGAMIGGTAPETGNVVAFNLSEGIIIGGGEACRIEGNWVGLNRVGDPSPNRSGIVVLNSPATQIGGETDRPGTPPGNVITANVQDGVRITGEHARECLVQGNLIGLAPDGIKPMGNIGGANIFIRAPETTVGGATVRTRNVIADGRPDVWVEGAVSEGSWIQGNFIGLTADGTARVESNFAGGVVLEHTRGIVIGALTNQTMSLAQFGTPPGNVIVGSELDIRMSNSEGVRVAGNVLGTDASGLKRLRASDVTADSVALSNCTKCLLGDSSAGNVLSDGIYVWDTLSFTIRPRRLNEIRNNHIGIGRDGTTRLAANLRYGISVSGSEENLLAGNRIGFAATGIVIESGGHNLISDNRIVGNTGPAIDLGGDGPTLNGTHNVFLRPSFDAPNAWEEYPLIRYFGPLNLGRPQRAIILDRSQLNRSRLEKIEFFGSTSTNPADTADGLLTTLFIEPYTYDGMSNVVTTHLSPLVTLPAGQTAYLAATRTSAFNDTSELAPALPFTFNPIDSDLDGSPDEVESAMTADSDANRDGIQDAQQATVIGVPGTQPGTAQTFIIEPGFQLQLGESSLPVPEAAQLPDEVRVQVGGQTVVIKTGTPRQAGPQSTGTFSPVRVTVLHQPVFVANRYYLTGTGANGQAAWIDFAWDGTTGAQFEGGRVHLVFIDGGRGDADGRVNGEILFRGAAAFAGPWPLRISGFGLISDAEVYLRFEGYAGRLYQVETLGQTGTWSAVRQARSDSGDSTLRLPVSLQDSTRFFRVVGPLLEIEF